MHQQVALVAGWVAARPKMANAKGIMPFVNSWVISRLEICNVKVFCSPRPQVRGRQSKHKNNSKITDLHGSYSKPGHFGLALIVGTASISLRAVS